LRLAFFIETSPGHALAAWCTAATTLIYDRVTAPHQFTKNSRKGSLRLTRFGFLGRSIRGCIEEVPISAVAVGDQLLLRAGEVVPIDGVVTSIAATIDESALTGEPIAVVKARGAAILSGSLNAGETFEMTVSAVAGESTHAGIVRLVTAAQAAKAPFVRLADRYLLIFLPVTLALAFLAWLISGDLIRSLAVFMAATPYPLILAAPVAFIAEGAQAARRGILVKGGGRSRGQARPVPGPPAAPRPVAASGRAGPHFRPGDPYFARMSALRHLIPTRI
jgi:magnesium-transporting ATPase (P-type)